MGTGCIQKQKSDKQQLPNINGTVNQLFPSNDQNNVNNKIQSANLNLNKKFKIQKQVDLLIKNEVQNKHLINLIVANKVQTPKEVDQNKGIKIQLKQQHVSSLIDKNQVKQKNSSKSPQNKIINKAQKIVKKRIYNFNSQLRNTFLTTIQLNILLDYDDQCTKQNLTNLKNFYKSVYSQKNSKQGQHKYKKLKKLWLDKSQQYQNQLKILKWFQTYRGQKYSQDIIGYTSQQKLKQVPYIQKKALSEVKLCMFTKNLNKIQFINENHQSQYHLIYMMTEVRIGKFYFKIQKQQKTQKVYLYQQRIVRQKRGQKKRTCWVLQATNDLRIIWRAYIKIDKLDVKKLLMFLLAERQNIRGRLYKQLKFQCPSIVINAGSHGISNGTNAFQTGDQQLLDSKIIDQTQQTIVELLQQNKQNKINLQLNEQNVMQKVHINDISLEKPAVYPHKANHIIDTQCSGAYSMIKAKYLQPQGKSHQQKDLLFLFQPNYVNKELKFWESSIIKNQQNELKLLNFFGENQSRIKHINLVFKASQYGFKVQKFWLKCGYYTHLLFICLTGKDKIIGAYSPLSHLYNGQGQKQYAEGQDAKDYTNTSFIYSLTQNDKFELGTQQYAVFRHKYKEFISFGKGELKICDTSNRHYCNVAINGYYHNQKYNQSDEDPYIRLIGEDTVQFKTKEWQVWKLQIQEQRSKFNQQIENEYNQQNDD